MGMAPNPIADGGPSRVLLSEHAKFRMAERGVVRDIVRELSTARTANFNVDETSGNIVFRIRGHRIVAKQLAGGEFMILSVFDEGQKPS